MIKNNNDRSALIVVAGLTACVVIAALALTLPEQTPPAPKTPRATPVVLAYRAVYPCAVAVYLPGKEKASGAGVIVDVRGYIVTSAHVVGGLKSLSVKLFDGSAHAVDVMAADTATDLAVLKWAVPPPSTLKAIVPVNPNPPLEVGETVIIIGSPYGHVQSVAAGIVSALHREIEMPTGETLKGIVQIDPPVNPGNSGGPLLNINGEMVGIIAAMQRDAGGVAFAVNAEVVAAFVAKHVPGASK